MYFSREWNNLCNVIDYKMLTSSFDDYDAFAVDPVAFIKTRKKQQQHRR